MEERRKTLQSGRKMNKLKYYLKIWWMMSKNAFLMVLSQRLGFSIFLIGKLVRFFFLYIFLVFLLKGTGSLAGYDSKQIIFFFLTFYFIDSVSQFLYREVYRFRPQVVSGSFDMTLTKPISALFRSLAGGADVIDLTFIPIILFALTSVGISLHPTFISVILYVFLIVNSLMIATAFHIAILATGILTLEIDNMTMIYRDLITLGRFPIEIYKQPLRAAITYIIPLGIMFTFPGKALINALSWKGILISLVVGILAIYLSKAFWRYSLKRYTSASS
ncbi:ABC-2 family transporter protein [Candidatus Microgenomates bacterium]|nr:ABC-2 family transporter protein [Candidatus Microgenomates bacterium]